MLLEDASSRKFSSVDFGRAADEGRRTLKGLGLPPPTEFIQAPSEVLETEAALLEAEREKSSLTWKVEVAARRAVAALRARMDQIRSGLAAAGGVVRERTSSAREFIAPRLAKAVLRLQSLRTKPELPSADPELPEVKLAASFDLSQDEQADTAKTPVPIMSGSKAKPRGCSQWDVTTQVVDMQERKKSKVTKEEEEKPAKEIPVNDLVLPPSSPQEG